MSFCYESLNAQIHLSKPSEVLEMLTRVLAIARRCIRGYAPESEVRERLEKLIAGLAKLQRAAKLCDFDGVQVAVEEILDHVRMVTWSHGSYFICLRAWLLLDPDHDIAEIYEELMLVRTVEHSLRMMFGHEPRGSWFDDLKLCREHRLEAGHVREEA